VAAQTCEVARFREISPTFINPHVSLHFLSPTSLPFPMFALRNAARTTARVAFKAQVS
jgi:hypothetical protein